MIANIFEKLMLHEIDKTDKNSKNQFGFKEGSSCQHAIFTLKETIILNKSKLNPTYVCAIDASEAFDKVNRVILRNKIKKKIKPKILKTLINMIHM